MSFILEKSVWSSIFAVPSSLVENHIKLCGEVQLKVLLTLLHCGGHMDIPQLAQKIGKSEAAVAEAILYWQHEGYLSQEPSPVREAAQAAAPPAATPIAATEPVVMPEAPPAAIPIPTPSTLQYTQTPDTPDDTRRKVTTLSSSRNRLGTKEINQMAEEDESIAFLLQESQSVLGKTLSPIATDTIVSLYSYYGMQPDLILMLLQYCVTIGKDNMRYVEKAAAGWLEKGVDSHEKAEAQIMQSVEKSQTENRIKSAFGIYDRKLVSSEKQYIAAWVKEFGFSVDMVTLAFERAVEQKGKLSFPYINGILSNWRTKGIATPAQAVQDMRAKSTAAGAAKGVKSASYDIGELENMINYQDILD